jgi:hypothetical protein
MSQAVQERSSSRLQFAAYGAFIGALSGLGFSSYLDSMYLSCTLVGLAVGFMLGMSLGRKSVAWLNELSHWLIR